MLDFDDDEDQDFDITKSGKTSKLANLFSNNETHLDINDSNSRLIYTPPKQPKKIEITTQSNSNSGNRSSNVMTLIHASAVNVFKFENGKYSPQGKLGAALLGNQESNSFKLILYTGKQQHITYASIDENFKFICQPNNYSSFYDDNRQNWSIMFDNEDDKCHFNKQLAFCKYNSIKKSDNISVLVQDLLLGNNTDSTEAEENDSIELKYKGWLHHNSNSAAKLFISQESVSKKPFRMKVEKNYTQLFNGFKTNGKRYVIIPYKLREQFSVITENAPNEQVLCYGFEFQLIKIRPKKTLKSDKPIEDNEQTLITNEVNVDKSSSESVKDEVQPIKSKSDILSRVAKMGGLPILPVKQDSWNTSSESSHTTDPIKNEEENMQMKPFPKPRNNSLNSGITVTDSKSKIPETNLNSNTIPNMAQIPVSLSNSYQIPSYFMTPNTNTAIESNLSLLANETRSNNTEIRMTLTKIIDKIDVVSEKVSDIKSGSNASLPVSSIGFMDSAILLSSIQRIVNENNSLKKELEEKTCNLQTLNEKICDLLQNSNNRDKNPTQEMERLLINETKLQRELRVMSEDCDRFKSKNYGLITENENLKKTINDLNFNIESISKKRVSNESNVTQTKEFSNQVKKVMNDVFRKFMAQIDENKTYESKEVIEIVTNSIRSATLAVIESRNNSERNSPSHQSIDEIDVKNEDKSNEFIKNSSQLTKESKRPPIPERRITEAQHKSEENFDNKQSTNEENTSQSLNIEESVTMDSDSNSSLTQLPKKSLASDEESKTLKPKLPSNSPPDFEFVYKDNEILN